jgi:hypothetical protein
MTLPRPFSRRLGIPVILVLAALGFGWALFLLNRSSTPPRVVIVASRLDSPGRDLGPGLGVLCSDTLEVLAGATVVQASSLPEPEALKRLPEGISFVRVQGRREGDQLSLVLEWTTAGRLLRGKAWHRVDTGPQEPAQALRRMVQQWPFPLRHRHLEDLLPRSTHHFWMLLEELSLPSDQEAAAHLPVTQQLADEEPGCALAWATLGDHLYRSLWVNPQAAGIGLNSRTHRAFQNAVERIPGYPRATFLWSLMLTDTGIQGLALEHLRKAVRLRPGCPDLYLGLAYAGRTAGLLEGARRALHLRQVCLGPLVKPSAWFTETTYLYQGDLAAFAQELAQIHAFRRDSNTCFYKGYFALISGDRQKALAAFATGGAPTMDASPFRDLCRVYQAHLEGRTAEGLADLRALDDIRGKLRIPDGEWTFKEAEAYALLGDEDRAMDAATRAFAQGFSCAAWYEGSPFLAPLRAHARWPMLRRNVRERQTLLESAFPPSTFGP